MVRQQPGHTARRAEQFTFVRAVNWQEHLTSGLNQLERGRSDGGVQGQDVEPGSMASGDRNFLERAEKILTEGLLLGLPDRPKLSVHGLPDVMAESRPGYHFVHDPRNQLIKVQGWLWRKVRQVPRFTAESDFNAQLALAVRRS